MNVFPHHHIFRFWSYRPELLVVSVVFLFLLFLPILAVILLTNTGINLISDRLASVDAVTKRVHLHDPTTGEVTKDIDQKRVWPVKGTITLHFGQSDLPYQVLHTGIDIASPNGKTGDPVTAFMPGKVVYAGEISWGYGKHIIIDHGSNITSVYAHLDTLEVQTGEEIKTTQKIIGREGKTGWATGPHLHFEVRLSGIPVNPIVFLP